MKRCGLHHSGRGMESHYEGVIIDGRAYIKAPAFRGSASKSEILEDGTIRSSGGYDFEDKAIFDKFQSEHPIVYGFIEMEGWEPIAVFLSERSKHITIGGEHYFPPICYPYFEEECDNGLVQLEIDGKWGYADIESGEIVISPVWDWCGPFYGKYAMVRTGCPGKPSAREPQSPGYFDGSNRPFVVERSSLVKDNPNYGWEWTMDSRCGYIDTHGELVVPLKYLDGDLAGRDGFFIAQKPERLIGVVDLNDNVIIDFDWFGINPLYRSSWSAFITYTGPLHEESSVYSLYSTQGELIVGNLEAHPEGRCSFLFGKNYLLKERSEKHYEKIEALGDWVARERYLLIWRGGKLGVVADGRLLQEPTLTWRQLWPIIKKDWEANKPDEEQDD